MSLGLVQDVVELVKFTSINVFFDYGPKGPKYVRNISKNGFYLRHKRGTCSVMNRVFEKNLH